MTSRTLLLLALLAGPSRASECPAKKCANWCKSELKENHCRVQPCCGCKMCDGIAMDAAISQRKTEEKNNLHTH